jgi:hypothetical protein
MVLAGSHPQVMAGQTCQFESLGRIQAVREWASNYLASYRKTQATKIPKSKRDSGQKARIVALIKRRAMNLRRGEYTSLEAYRENLIQSEKDRK